MVSINIDPGLHKYNVRKQMAKVAFQRQQNVNNTRNEEVYDHIMSTKRKREGCQKHSARSSQFAMP